MPPPKLEQVSPPRLRHMSPPRSFYSMPKLFYFLIFLLLMLGKDYFVRVYLLVLLYNKVPKCISSNPNDKISFHIMIATPPLCRSSILTLF